MKKLNRKGFTLIELLAVIVILAVVLVVTIPSVISSMNKAKESQLQNAADTATEWFTKQYELATLGTVAGDPDPAYTTFGGVTTTSKPLTAEVLKAAGVTDTEGLISTGSTSTSTVNLTATGKVCVKLEAKSGPFFVSGGNNKVNGSGC